MSNTLDTISQQTLFIVDQAPDEWNLVKSYKAPVSYSYNGNAEDCVFTFKLLPEQIPGQDWIQDKVVAAFTAQMTRNGRQLLELYVYEDITPTFYTEYKIEVVYTDPRSAMSTMMFGPQVAHIGLIIAAVLTILFIVAITFAIIEIRKLWYGEGNGASGSFGEMISMVLIMMMLMMAMKFMPSYESKKLPPELPPEEISE